MKVISYNSSKNPFNAGLKWYEYIICGLPFVLVVAGGAVGAAVGFIGFSLNIKLWKSNSSIMIKVIKVIGVTITTLIVYFILGLAFTLLIKR